MSAALEPIGDLVAVACVVDASLLLASEWSRVLIEYVHPLLKRLQDIYPSHLLRLAFVTYATADTRPRPLLSKTYFAPLSQITKVLREEPSKLGIGQTNSPRGLSALEGLVAAIEMFDTLMTSVNSSTNHAQSPQKDARSFIFHILHIAASPPDAAQRPHCNTLQHLDFINWDSIPAELRKRKINLSLIGLRKIPQFQDLQSSVAGPGVQPPWFNVHTPHVLLLAGFPTPQKISTKRPAEPQPSEQSPEKRPKVAADPISKRSSASPALTPARISQTQRPQQAPASQITQPPPPPTTASGQNSSPVQPVQAPASVPAPTPVNTTPSAPPSLSASTLSNEILDQVVPPTGFKFRQMMERLSVLERDITTLTARIADARDKEVLIKLQRESTEKGRVREQIKELLRRHYHRVLLAKASQNAQPGAPGSAPPNPPVETGSSTPAHPSMAPSAANERPAGPTMEEQKAVISGSQAVAQLWQARGGAISGPSGSNSQAGPSQMQLHATMTPEIAATQKLMEKQGIRLPTSGTPSHEVGANPTVTNNQVPQNTTIPWLGMFSGTFPKLSANEVQIQVVGAFTTPKPTDTRTEIRIDTWPKNFILHSCKQPVSNAELTVWIKRHQSRTRIMQFIPSPRAANVPLNGQRFQALYNFMSEHRMYAYAGWQSPSGTFSYNIFIFPTGKSFAGAVFPDGLPDLPGGGNALDIPPSVPEVKPHIVNGITIPPQFIARLQQLDPGKQRQLLAYYIRSQQEQLRRQQLQQAQQSHPGSGQGLSSLGMSIPPNQYSTMANIPPGLHPNLNPPANVGVYNNAGGGTVSDEMLQSFMQRSAEGAALPRVTLG